MTKSLIVLAGPTASGKTALAIVLARHFRTEIISADSRQFFKEMNIGTARPSQEELSAVKHHLIASHSIHEEYNIGKFEREALSILEILFRDHDTALLAGGSGLYISALCQGFDELPVADPALREELARQHSLHGISYLRQELEKLDPVYYAAVDLNNPQRLMRALEVCIVSGQPYSSLRRQEKKQRPFRIVKIGLDMEREQLYERISRRVDAMMQAGLLEEAKALYPHRSLNALQTVGYTELFEHLEGRITLPEAVDKIKQNTRRYAKRQLTWFRRDPELTWFRPEQEEEIIRFIEKKIDEGDI